MCIRHLAGSNNRSTNVKSIHMSLFWLCFFPAGSCFAVGFYPTELCAKDCRKSLSQLCCFPGAHPVVAFQLCFSPQGHVLPSNSIRRAHVPQSPNMVKFLNQPQGASCPPPTTRNPAGSATSSPIPTPPS